MSDGVKSKTYLCLVLLFVSVQVDLSESGRYGGGRTSGSRRSGSAPRPKPSSNIRPSDQSRLSHRPAPNIGWNIPSHPAPKQPVHKVDHKSIGSGAAPGLGWKVPSSHAGSSNTQSGSIGKVDSKPVGSGPSNVYQPPKPSAPLPPPQPSAPLPPVGGSLPQAPRPGARPPAYGWNPPGAGANNYNRPVGPPQHNFAPNSGSNPMPNIHYSSHSNGPVIINKNYNHYSYSVPQPNYHYPSYYQPPAYYHYSTSETGSGVLGFYLGYSLGRLTTPTYSHYSFYDGYRPRYDHYTVHHYYHDRENIPKDPVIKSNAIIGCVGDATQICPANTTSLCTNTGTLMCIASLQTTTPCLDNGQVNCVKSTVPCLNSTAPECKSSQSNTTSINVPCIYTTTIDGNFKYVNNTIVVNNPPTVNVNVTPASASAVTTTTLSLPLVGIEANSNSSTQYPITTMPSTTTSDNGTLMVNTTEATKHLRKRRENQQMFCVTIVASPAKRQITEGEKAFDSIDNIVSKFLAKTWGL